MTQDALHGLGLDLRLVHKPIRKRVPEIVEPESLAVSNLKARGFSCRPEMVGNKDSGGDWHTAFRFDRRKYEVRLLGVRRLCVPFPEAFRKSGVQGNMPLGFAGFGRPLLPARPAFGDCYLLLIPKHICPA